MNFEAAMDACPLVAILRGIRLNEVDAVSDALIEAGFRMIEVPLNSPEPLKSIERLANRHGEVALVGAGTVMTPDDVIDVRDAGGQLIVTPHTDVEIIDEAKAEGLICIPGSATPTEAFTALSAGADAIKMFPGESLPPPVVKAWRAIFPADTRLLVVGGVNADNMSAYQAAGANGFGIGSSLYAPGRPASEVGEAARALLVAANSYRA
jgi:2-dehydro-3-deoxyphosphogalactonate aldolase